MKMEISNNMLAALVLIAMAASFTATVTIMSKFPAEQFPITGMAPQTEGTGLANVTLEAEANIKLIVDYVNFVTIAAGSENDTTNDFPEPFLILNNGTAHINVSIAEQSSALFWDVEDDSCEECFQFNASGNGSTWYQTANNTVWTDFSPGQNAEVASFANLYTDPPNLVFNFSNLAGEKYMEVDIRIDVPNGEPSGYKEGTVLFKASLSS